MEKAFQVVVTGPRLAPEAVELLAPSCALTFLKAYTGAEEMAGIVGEKQADALLVRSGKVEARVIAASRRLKVIAKHGVGYDNIDVHAATRAGIPVLISAHANFEAVAEHALGFMLALAKNTLRMDARMRQGHWDKMEYRGRELAGRTLGIIGFGRIGRRLYRIISPLRMKVVIYDPFIPPEVIPKDAVRVDQMEDLLRQADVVSLHCPLTELTRNMIGARELALMKKSAWIINTARGGILEEEALLAALEKGEIEAAALDVFAQEPPGADHPLYQSDRVVLSPHVAGVSEEATVRMGTEAARNILTILEGRPPDADCLVNSPAPPVPG